MTEDRIVLYCLYAAGADMCLCDEMFNKRRPSHLRGDQRTGVGVRTKVCSLELELGNLCWLPANLYLHRMVQPVQQKHLNSQQF